MKLLLFALSAAFAFGQAIPYKHPPDLADVRYGPYPRNVMDLWFAKSSGPAPLVVSIHGGGFRGGDKTALNPLLLELMLERGISVAAIHYRFTQQAVEPQRTPYPGPMLDGARAVQYLRLHAREWNLDKTRIGATGGSAGAGLSLWIGFHDDLADPKNADAVLRESSRLAAVGVFGAQTTYDPRVVAKVVGEPAIHHGLFEPLVGLSKGDSYTAKSYELFEDASAINHVSMGDPPVMLIYNEPDVDLPPDAKDGTAIHSPRFGQLLKKRMDAIGLDCELDELTVPAADPKVQHLLADFFAARLKGNSSK